MAKLDNRPIEDLINITIEYFDNNTVSNNVTKREVVNAVSEYVANLKRVGINTIGTYLSANLTIVSKYFPMNPEYSIIIEEALSNKLMTKEEVNNEFSLFSIDELEVSNRVKNALKNNGITNLGELLETDYSVLEGISYFGPDCLSELKRYIHALGLQLKNEKITVEDKYDELNAKGIRLLQDDLLLSGKVVNLLNRNGIFTLQELIDFGENVYHLTRMGKVKADELRNALAKRGIDLEKPIEEPVSTEITEESVLAGPADEKLEDTFVPSILPSDEVVEQIKQMDPSIKEKDERIKKILSEIDRLTKDNIDLSIKIHENNKELEKDFEILQSYKNEEEGLSYGGK